MKKTLGLYLHIPFCRSKCLYCDFCSMPHPSDEAMEAYVEALCRDLHRWSETCADYTVDTVFFGGGTPTVLPVRLLERLTEVLWHDFCIDPMAEITAECNPVTGERERFLRMRGAGFNRLSIGLQSVHREELRALGRLHDFDTFCHCFSDAREAGFENISADVMSGIPHQTPQSRMETLQKLCALGPEHISSYDLIIEEGTPFARAQERLALPVEEAARQMYFEGCEFLTSGGWKQYEISNFAKEGYESRHNLKYWSCEEYLGLGVAAHSDFGGARFGNSRDVSAYLRGEDITEEHSIPSLAERMNEYVMLRMRLCEGVDYQAFARRFGRSFESVFGKGFSAYEPHGLVICDGAHCAFTTRGMLVSNAILSEVLDFSGEI